MSPGSSDAEAIAAAEQTAHLRRRRLGSFLQSVERRALRMLELGTRHREEALDLLQDAMLRFVDRYGGRPESEWPPLFFRIVDRILIDWSRRQAVRQRVRSWWGAWTGDGAGDRAESLPDPRSARPEQRQQADQFAADLERALRALPLRQRQVFLLREWQQLSVEETARALRVSAGSVKTHLSRARGRLQELLHDHH